ncbi:hypothetical protein J6500_21380 [Bradyrhizobium sp. WSM 1704]|uniref:hypothetical protein n=1 Tax=Bradyrhizobium semiaridum TaxID=2821404 RepID=UPI001CE32B54|nr:hypothetical protein [Bradyrhizobium semiaridum]MCA6124423.1 hypothetical protein [Bradyrhizobium semiaridum]
MPGEEHHLRYIPEPPSVSKALIGWSALTALLLLGISIGGLYGIYRSSVPTAHLPAPQEFPQPRVGARENQQLRRILDAQNKRLEAWGWFDAQHTMMQIPIERAMQSLVQKGNAAYAPLLPPEPALSSPTAAADRATMQDKKPQEVVPAVPNPPTAEPQK